MHSALQPPGPEISVHRISSIQMNKKKKNLLAFQARFLIDTTHLCLQCQAKKQESQLDSLLRQHSSN